MSYVQERDQVFQLAPSKAAEALVIARRISMPWYKAQALAAVARWIDADRVEGIAGESVAAAIEGTDDYKRSAAMAWTVAALAERDSRQLALESLNRARRIAETATPQSSRAYALGLLLRAAWPLGAEVRHALIEEIADLQRQDSFWRISRVLVDSLGLLEASEDAFAHGIVDRMADARWQRKARSALERRGPLAPETFFRR